MCSMKCSKIVQNTEWSVWICVQLYWWTHACRPEFWFALLCVHSSSAIILLGNRELVDLICLSSWCLVIVMALLRGATGLSTGCDCGISWSYSITIYGTDQFKNCTWIICREKGSALWHQIVPSFSGWLSMADIKTSSIKSVVEFMSQINVSNVICFSFMIIPIMPCMP